MSIYSRGLMSADCVIVQHSQMRQPSSRSNATVTVGSYIRLFPTRLVCGLVFGCTAVSTAAPQQGVLGRWGGSLSMRLLRRLSASGVCWAPGR